MKRPTAFLGHKGITGMILRTKRPCLNAAGREPRRWPRWRSGQGVSKSYHDQAASLTPTFPPATQPASVAGIPDSPPILNSGQHPSRRMLEI